MQLSRLAIAALAMAVLPRMAQAQSLSADTPSPEVAASVAPASPSGPIIRLPAGTVVEVEVTQALSSKTSAPGDLFTLRLLAPIVIDGNEVVPAGAIGGGEVIDAHASAFGGRQGRLIVSARFLELGGQQVRIRGMQLMAAGSDRINRATGLSFVPVVGIAAIFIEGDEIEIPAGASGTARLAVDVDLPVAAPADMVAVEPAAEATAITSTETNAAAAGQ